jgi:hypothetical protein
MPSDVPFAKSQALHVHFNPLGRKKEATKTRRKSKKTFTAVIKKVWD